MTITEKPKIDVTKSIEGDFTHQTVLELRVDDDENKGIGERITSEKIGFKERGKYEDREQTKGVYFKPGYGRVTFIASPKKGLRNFRYIIEANSTVNLLDIMGYVQGAVKSLKYEGSD